MRNVKPSQTDASSRIKPQNLQHDLVSPTHDANQKLIITIPPRMDESGPIACDVLKYGSKSIFDGYL